jgi:hypothetical protein
MRYASSAVAFNSLFYHLPSLTCPQGVARLPQGRKWRRLYRGILFAYRTAVAGGAGFEAALAAAVDAAQNRLFIPAMLAGDVLRQLPFPYADEPVYMPPCPSDIARGVWRYWDAHPYGCGSVPLYEQEILIEPYWLKK